MDLLFKFEMSAEDLFGKLGICVIVKDKFKGPNEVRQLRHPRAMQ
jgi:hypothetical protein